MECCVTLIIVPDGQGQLDFMAQFLETKTPCHCVLALLVGTDLHT